MERNWGERGIYTCSRSNSGSGGSSREALDHQVVVVIIELVELVHHSKELIGEGSGRSEHTQVLWVERSGRLEKLIQPILDFTLIDLRVVWMWKHLSDSFAQVALFLIMIAIVRCGVVSDEQIKGPINRNLFFLQSFQHSHFEAFTIGNLGRSCEGIKWVSIRAAPTGLEPNN